MFVKKWPLDYQQVFKTLLPTYLWDSSDSSDICASCDSIDSSDSSDSGDIKKNIYIYNFFYIFCFTKKKITKNLHNSNCDETHIVMKLKKLKFWGDLKTQIVMKLKNSNCDKTQKLKLW